MFASQHWGVSPDIMTLAKGLGSAFAHRLTVARRRYMEKGKRGANGNTFGGNPVCCAAALATLDLVEPRVRCECGQRRRVLYGGLRELQKRFDCIGDVVAKADDRMELVTTGRAARPPKPCAKLS